MKVFVLGDIGGHASSFKEALTFAGYDFETNKLPVGVSLVQAGDAIHKGPDSKKCLDIIEKLFEYDNDFSYLLGNHEALYVGKTNFGWKDKLDSYDASRLKSWFKEGKLPLMKAFTSKAGGDGIITHAGLTRNVWKNLDSITNVEKLTRRVNTSSNQSLFAPGMMLTGVKNVDAGVIWAQAPQELIMPWVKKKDLPFNQIHGHSSAYWWGKNTFTMDETLLPEYFLDKDKKHLWVKTNNKYIIGIDPGFSTYANKFQPLSFEGQIL